MKYMGWSYADLRDCPDDLVPVIGRVMQREADANRRAARGR